MTRQSIFSVSTFLLLLLFSANWSAAQSPAFVIQGPVVTLDQGCGNDTLDSSCVSVDYDQSEPTSATIAQTRLLKTPRGNLMFQIPVASFVPGTSRLHTNVVFNVNVTVRGANGELAGGGGSKVFHTFGHAMIQIPINIDWAVSAVTFQITVSETQSGICGTDCVNAGGQFTGPDLSNINFALNIPSAFPFPHDAFVLVETPAAAFQLPVLPTTIIYAPLGNGPQAVSSFTVTNITATNQAFTNTNDVTNGINHDDKTQFSWGLSLSLGVINDVPNDFCSMGTKCAISAGFKEMGTWDKSVETDNEDTFAATGSVAAQYTNSQQHTVRPRTGQPPLDHLTLATEPFWMDKFLVVTDPQFAVWDYPAGSVVQPLGSAHIVELPLLQLDSCANSPAAIEPAFITPQPWTANQVYAVNDLVLDANNMIQVVTTPGTSGATAPNWNKVNGGLTTDGGVTWKNQEALFGIYRGSVTLDTPQYLSLTNWAPGQAYPQGTIVKLGDSIEVATTGGMSGGTLPTFNTTSEATTVDGTVIWTNEQDHFLIYAGPVLQAQTVFQWLTSSDCSEIASLDSFYVSKSQSAAPLSYRLLGSGSVSPAGGAATAYTSSQQTMTTVGQSSTFKHTIKVTHITTAEENLSASLDVGLRVAWAAIGLSGTVSRTKDQTTTITNTTVDSSQLQLQQTNTGITAVSTTIQDNGNEQSIPVNVMQDSFFGGIAVQDTDIHLNSSIATLSSLLGAAPVLPIGEPNTSDAVNGVARSETQTSATTTETKALLRALHEEAAQRHMSRDVPAPGPATTRNLSREEMLRILRGVKSPKPSMINAIKSVQAEPQRGQEE